MTTLLLLSTLLAAEPGWSESARLDSVIQRSVHAGFSGTVLIAHGDRILFERSYGAAAATGIAPGQLAYWIASDSKQFTAAAILKLQELGRLRVTDSVGRFFDGVPVDKRGITIHQLLTHTSGLPSAYRSDGVSDRDQAVAGILQLRLGAPGTYSYSNDGYNLLAAIVDKASGSSFDAFVRDSLFARAGLEHTGLWGFEQPGVAIAAPFDPKRVSKQSAAIYANGHSVDNWGFRGAGGVYATAEDLHRWIRALMAGRVLSPDSYRQLLGRHVLVRADSTQQNYTGYGWGVRVIGGQDVSYGHAGYDDWLGQSAIVRFTPDGDVVIVLANSGERGDGPWADAINRTIRGLLDPPAQAARGTR